MMSTEFISCCKRSSRHRIQVLPRRGTMWPSLFTLVVLCNLQLVACSLSNYSLKQSVPASLGTNCSAWIQRYNLTAQQSHLCRTNHSLFESVATIGISSDVEAPSLFERECQYWMEDERWNCSGIKAPLFPGHIQPFMSHLTRETAFVQALLSAMYFSRLAKGFRSCDGERVENTAENLRRWVHCQEAQSSSVDLLDGMWSTNQDDEQRLVHIHNLEAGRRAVTAPENVMNYCRCHGPTTSCTVKTCQWKLNYRSHIGTYIKETLYPQARKVVAVRAGGHGSLRLIDAETQTRSPPHDMLIYTEEPDYCSESASVFGAVDSSNRRCELPGQSYVQNRLGTCGKICCNGYVNKPKVRTQHRCIAQYKQDFCQHSYTRLMDSYFCK
uniref:Protein Wnt n=1 Tax=Halisarca dujardinii TaxID=2583056 RepID=A0A175C5R4_HALDU